MANRWKRWRGYMDEMEEALRLAGEHLARIEEQATRQWQRRFWPRPQREAVDPQLVARALDIPFLRRLLAAARRMPPGVPLPPPPAELKDWEEGEDAHYLLSTDRQPPLAPAGRPAGAPPARLRAAERALAHRSRSMVVVLEELVNPRNASAIVRTLEALGGMEVHFVDRRGRVQLHKAITRLCQRWMDLHWHRQAGSALEALRGRGYRILAADFGEGSLPLDEVELGEKVAVVLGSEQEGVSPELRAAADGLFHVPTVGFTSYLNVSVTAGMALYEIDRRQRAAGLRRPLEPAETSELRAAWYAALAGAGAERRRDYAAWLAHPPEPLPQVKDVPSREKAREEG